MRVRMTNGASANDATIRNSTSNIMPCEEIAADSDADHIPFEGEQHHYGGCYAEYHIHPYSRCSSPSDQIEAIGIYRQHACKAE